MNSTKFTLIAVSLSILVIIGLTTFTCYKIWGENPAEIQIKETIKTDTVKVPQFTTKIITKTVLSRPDTIIQVIPGIPVSYPIYVMDTTLGDPGTITAIDSSRSDTSTIKTDIPVHLHAEFDSRSNMFVNGSLFIPPLSILLPVKENVRLEENLSSFRLAIATHANKYDYGIGLAVGINKIEFSLESGNIWTLGIRYGLLGYGN